MHDDVIDSTSRRDLVFKHTPQLWDLAGSCNKAPLGSIEACWRSDWLAEHWTRSPWPRIAQFPRGCDDGEAWRYVRRGTVAPLLSHCLLSTVAVRLTCAAALHGETIVPRAPASPKRIKAVMGHAVQTKSSLLRVHLAVHGAVAGALSCGCPSCISEGGSRPPRHQPGPMVVQATRGSNAARARARIERQQHASGAPNAILCPPSLPCFAVPEQMGCIEMQGPPIKLLRARYGDRPWSRPRC
jgi:hypothetical protein